jgi:sec-independent protein translocase protein TatC
MATVPHDATVAMDPRAPQEAAALQIAEQPAAPAPGPGDGKPVELLDDKRMSLIEHLVELRSRLRNALLAFVVALGASFWFVATYFDWLTLPVRRGLKAAGHEPKFYAASLTEPFWVYAKIALVGALIIALPFILWEVWKFVAPGLYKRERRLTVLIVGATAVCFAGGAVFAYAFMCEPAAYFLTKMLVSFGGDVPFRLDPMIMMDEVADFQMMTMTGCGLAFELPVVLSILGWIGLVSARGLLKFNKYALVIAVILGGVLTPGTDPFTQVLLAVPLFGLYNLSILVVWVIERARRKKDQEIERQYAASPAAK